MKTMQDTKFAPSLLDATITPHMAKPSARVSFLDSLAASAWLVAATVICVLNFASPAPAQPLEPGLKPALDDDRVQLRHTVSVQDIARIEGQGTTVLRGIGLVTGLRGTGDSGSEEVLARPLAEYYRQNGMPLPDIKVLSKAKSVAIVAIEVVIPPAGAVRDDTFNVTVSVCHSASSLLGGKLLLTALTGPLPGQGVYGFANGDIILDNLQVPTAGVIRRGAKVIADIRMPAPVDSFNLVLSPAYRHFAAADMLASTVNSAIMGDMIDDSQAASRPPATVLDHTTVHVAIPLVEQGNVARYIARIMSAEFSPELLRQPAIVRINQRTGSIVASANVEISAAAITHKDLQITTLTPPPVPSAAAPQVTTSRWTGVSTTGRSSDRARLNDLLAAFKQLDIPIDSQIAVLTELYQAGKLHAELIFE